MTDPINTLAQWPSPLYMNDVFKPAGENTTATRTSLFKLSHPLRKTNHGQKCISYKAPSI